MSEFNKPEHQDETQAIVEKTKKALSRSAEQMDAKTVSRLQEARRAALASATADRRTHFGLPLAIPASALAFAFAMLIIWPQLNQHEDSGASDIAFGEQIEDLILMSELDDETLELVEEIEFAYWLSQEMDAASDAVQTLGVDHNG